MDDSQELTLVRKAFALARGASGYVEWCDDRAVAVAREKLADLNGLTPEAVRTRAIDYVNDGGAIIPVVETRPEWSDFRYYYKVILPVEDFPRGVFVETRLIDEDPNDPVVHIVSAHRQGV